MARLNPYLPRSKDTRELNLGRAILFCEGRTEENYFNHFAQIINNKSKYTDVEVFCTCAEGNAQRVLNYANDFLREEPNAILYREYDKYLVFDCDAPTDIERVIGDMIMQDRYDLLLTNILFETWLLMHYEYVDSRKPIRKGDTFQRLANNLNILEYGDSEKNDEGIIRKIIGNGDAVRFAIENAERLRMEYFDDVDESKYNFAGKLGELNPYTRVDILIKQIMIEISKSK